MTTPLKTLATIAMVLLQVLIGGFVLVGGLSLGVVLFFAAMTRVWAKKVVSA